MDQLLTTARTVRGYLTELLGPVEGARIDALLAGALARAAAGEDVGEEVAAVLGQRPDVLSLATSILADPDHRPPQVRAAWLSGDGEPVDAHRFVCAEGDYIWYRLDIGQRAPRCPTHGSVLVADGGTA
ncbi:hypothetical protein OHA46_20350 [Streptomyces sp. NBC_00708]